MRTAAGIAAGICCLPFFACADSQAGFPSQTFWLSPDKPAYGERVKLNAVLHNGTNARVEGTLRFTVDGAIYDSRTIQLNAGESRIETSSWTATAGAHSFSADFKSGGGAGGTEQHSAAVNVSIAAPAPPSALELSVSQATQAASAIASSSAPFIQEAAHAVFAKTEALRNAGIAAAEKYANEPTTQQGGAVHGVSTSTAVAGFGAPGTKTGSFLHSAAQTAAASALFTLRSLWLFYPLLAFLFFLLLRFLYRWINRPRF